MRNTSCHYKFTTSSLPIAKKNPRNWNLDFDNGFS